MIYLTFFLICFLASVIGAICGIGGGIIIKPVLDAFGVLSISAINFLSGCTVLAMTTYSMVKSRINGDSHVRTAIGVPLAVGAVTGGIAGKELFSAISRYFENQNRVGAVQAECLFVVTVGTLLYTINRSKIASCKVTDLKWIALIGFLLGMLSSFLGIGGGPINIIVLFFFFSMKTKEAVDYSLYIIFFSQAANLALTFLTGAVPAIRPGILFLMVVGGIMGGILGRKMNQKVDDDTVNTLFIFLLVIIIMVNTYNIYKFTIGT